MPIIGMDLRQHHNLIIDTRKRRLVDGNAHLSVCVTSFTGRRLAPVPIRYTIDPFYQPLLDTYPGTHQTQPKLPCVTSNVTHHIMTKRPPVFPKARRLAAEKLRLARNEFDHMLALGIIRLSNSPYASPLHMVLKKDGTDRCSTGDYWIFFLYLLILLNIFNSRLSFEINFDFHSNNLNYYCTNIYTNIRLHSVYYYINLNVFIREL
ncbi:unnamed protein product [Schistosoma mattheei]|uniref:Uncharacterized protein n=1 Tax=Schistosoma mattheei TaxID=31246 RepID=A0A183PQ79_9TREM|nr:unnamed protein product [Schistosoma mattheei]